MTRALFECCSILLVAFDSLDLSLVFTCYMIIKNDKFLRARPFSLSWLMKTFFTFYSLLSCAKLGDKRKDCLGLLKRLEHKFHVVCA